MKEPNEITLAEWADKHGIAVRTAQGWAKTGLINAKKKKRAVRMTINRLVRTYFIDAATIPPSDQVVTACAANNAEVE